jgi:hypothetical protein
MTDCDNLDGFLGRERIRWRIFVSFQKGNAADLTEKPSAENMIW